MRFIAKWQTAAATMNACHTSWYPNTAGAGSGRRVAKTMAQTVYNTPPTIASAKADGGMPWIIAGNAINASHPSDM